MDNESQVKAINALMVFIQDMSDDLANVKGQVQSLQESFYKKLVVTQEPLSEDWAKAQLDEFRHRQDGAMAHVKEALRKLNNMEVLQDSMEDRLCKLENILKPLKTVGVPGDVLAVGWRGLEPGEIVPVKCTLEERITKLELEHDKLTQLVNEVVHG